MKCKLINNINETISDMFLKMPLPIQRTTSEEWIKLREKLANIEHQRWSDWQSWCHKILRENCPSEQMEKVLEKWDKQIATSYENLTEKEKDSDREQVFRYLPIVEDFVLQKQREAIEEYKSNLVNILEKGIEIK